MAGKGRGDADVRKRRRIPSTSSSPLPPVKEEQEILMRPSASPGTIYGALLPLNLLSTYLASRGQPETALYQAFITSSLLFIWTLLEANKTSHWLFSYLQRRLVAFGLLLAYFSGDVDFSASLLLSVLTYLVLMKEASSPPIAGNFSIGERSLTSQAMALFIGASMKNALLVIKYDKPFVGSRNVRRELWEVNCVVQAFGCVTFLALAVTRFIGRGKARKSIFLVALVFGVVLAWMTLSTHVLGESLFSWILRITVGSQRKLNVLLLWSGLLASAAGFAVGAGLLQDTPRGLSATIERKLFHVAITLVFVLGVNLEPNLLHLASSLLFWAFLVAEVVRVLDIWPFGTILNTAFRPFLDEKDLHGPLTLTHIYLLVGCATPIWLSAVTSSYRPLSSLNRVTLLAGVLCVGVGDAAASIGGQWFGRTKWRGSNKSVEGSVCCALAQAATVLLLVFTGYELTLLGWIIVTVAIVASTLLEAFTDQVDNLVLPFVSYAILVHL